MFAAGSFQHSEEGHGGHYGTATPARPSPRRTGIFARTDGRLSCRALASTFLMDHELGNCLRRSAAAPPVRNFWRDFHHGRFQPDRNCADYTACVDDIDSTGFDRINCDDLGKPIGPEARTGSVVGVRSELQH